MCQTYTEMIGNRINFSIDKRLFVVLVGAKYAKYLNNNS